MKIRRLLTAGVAAGLLVLTGCGGSSSSSPNADASTTGGGASTSDIRIDVITAMLEMIDFNGGRPLTCSA